MRSKQYTLLCKFWPHWSNSLLFSMVCNLKANSTVHFGKTITNANNFTTDIEYKNWSKSGSAYEIKSLLCCVGFPIVFLKIPPLVSRAQKVNDTHHVILFRGQPSYFTAYLFRIATTSITIRMSSPCHLLLQKKSMVQVAFASLIVPIAFEAISVCLQKRMSYQQGTLMN